MGFVVDMNQDTSGLSSLVNRALAGEDVIIARDGTPIARVVPIRSPRVPGLARGKIILHPDFDAPLPDDVLDAFRNPEGE